MQDVQCMHQVIVQPTVDTPHPFFSVLLILSFQLWLVTKVLPSTLFCKLNVYSSNSSAVVRLGRDRFVKTAFGFDVQLHRKQTVSVRPVSTE